MNQFQSFGAVIEALKRRVVLILAVTFAGTVLAVFYAMNQPQTFSATAVVQIEEAQVPDQLAGATVSDSDAVRRVSLIKQRLMARDTLLRIMEEYDLFNADPSMTINQRIEEMREATRIDEIREPSQSFGGVPTAPSGLRITVMLGDPDKVAQVANEMMGLVIEQARDRSASRARDTLDLFDTEETRVGAEIEALEARIAAFKRENAEQLPDGMADLRSQLADLRDAELDLDQQILTIETTSDRQREEVKERQIALLQEQKALIGERVTQIEQQIEGAPDVERALNGLEREMTRLREQYEI